MKKFDLTVIGSGPGGYIAGIRASQLGMNVAVIERDKPGGVCLNWGCIPSKAILKCAEVYNYVVSSENYGIKTDGVSYDYSKVIDKSQHASSTLNKGVEFLLKKNNITLFKGVGKFVKENQIAVLNKENIEIHSDKILIATGSVPRTIPGLEIDNKIVMTSDEAIRHREVPKSVVIIGGGYIGVEFAYVYNSFGSKVTIVEMEKNIIPGADEEVAQELRKVFKKHGIEILTETKYKSIKKQKTSATVTVEDIHSGEEKNIKTSLVLVAIGRRAVANASPSSFSYYGKDKSLGLDEIGVKFDDNGFIKVDKDYMTTKNNIYAIGDVTGPPLLAHKASEEGVAAVEIMNGIKSRVHYNKIPGCVYCQPEVGTLGLTEKQVKEQGFDYAVGKFPFKAAGKAVAVGDTDGFVKILSDKKTGEILGTHIIGHGATELIAELSLASSLEATPLEIAYTSHAHPTLSEAIMEAALGALGRTRNF